MFLVPSLAFGMPSAGEWMLILVVGVMIYGRRLPEVGRQVGRTFARLRRGYDEFRRELDRDESLRQVRTGIRDMRASLDAPRRALDPRRMIDDAMRTEADPDGAHPVPEEGTETWRTGPPPPDNLFGDSEPLAAGVDSNAAEESGAHPPDDAAAELTPPDTVDEPADEARRAAPPST